MLVFAWAALGMFTVLAGGLMVLLGRALFHALDRVDRVRDEVWTMTKTMDTVIGRLDRIEGQLGAGDGRLDVLRDELRSAVRRDLREIVEGVGAGRPRP